MHWLDVFLLFWLLIALYMGTRAGFVYATGRLIGLALGVWLAGRWTPGLASAFGSHAVITVIVFLILLSLITTLGGLLAWVVDKFFHILTIIPFLKTFNKVFGGILGVCISAIIISMGVLAVQLFATHTAIATTVAESRIATTIGNWSRVYSFLLPPQWTPMGTDSSTVNTNHSDSEYTAPQNNPNTSPDDQENKEESTTESSQENAPDTHILPDQEPELLEI